MSRPDKTKLKGKSPIVSMQYPVCGIAAIVKLQNLEVSAVVLIRDSDYRKKKPWNSDGKRVWNY
jgi:hypothetical protein